MSGPKPPNGEIVTPGSVDPDLVTEQEFGSHESYRRGDERIWKFKTTWGTNKFSAVSHLPKYQRKQEAKANNG